MGQGGGVPRLQQLGKVILRALARLNASVRERGASRIKTGGGDKEGRQLLAEDTNVDSAF